MIQVLFQYKFVPLNYDHHKRHGIIDYSLSQRSDRLDIEDCLISAGTLLHRDKNLSSTKL